MRNAGNAQQIEIGWWPGDQRYPRPAFFGFASPAPDGFADGELAPAAGGWDSELGEFILDWDELRASADPHATAREFGRAVIAHACQVCEWDPALAASAQGVPSPVT
jgi:hypothetical protein